MNWSMNVRRLTRIKSREGIKRVSTEEVGLGLLDCLSGERRESLEWRSECFRPNLTVNPRLQVAHAIKLVGKCAVAILSASASVGLAPNFRFTKKLNLRFSSTFCNFGRDGFRSSAFALLLLLQSVEFPSIITITIRSNVGFTATQCDTEVYCHTKVTQYRVDAEVRDSV